MRHHSSATSTQEDVPSFSFPEYDALSLKEKRRAGHINFKWDFETEANRKLWVAFRWSPFLATLSRIACLVAVLSTIAAVVVVYNRPLPLVLLSFSDGGLRCAQPGLDKTTFSPLQRTERDAQLCASYEPPQPVAYPTPIQMPISDADAALEISLRSSSAPPATQPTRLKPDVTQPDVTQPGVTP